MPRKAAQVPVSEERPAPGGVASVDRALSVLNAFTTQTPLLSLSELAERTRQYKSTVLRMLASLEFAHLVRRHSDGRFGLGSAVARLHAIYTTSFSFGDVVLPALHGLVAETRESAAFHVQQGDQVLCLYRVDSPHAVRDHARAGDVLPLARGVAGHVFASYSGVRGPLHTKTRRLQVLVDEGRIEAEVAGVAAPTFGPAGDVIGVVVLTMPSTRLQAGYAMRIRDVARELTEQFGGKYPSGRH
jgi:DNA-binding IclR family transcriptional regulator